MDEDYSEEVDKWIREFTTEEWGPTPATHCMSDRYQRLNPRSWPFPGVPSFSHDSVENDQSSGETANSERSREPDLSARDDPDKMVQFITETRSQYRDYINHDAEGVSALVERAALLREEIERLEEDTERLAAIIDERFKVIRERSEEELAHIRETAEEYPLLIPTLDDSKQVETDIVRETHRLQLLLSRATEDVSDGVFWDVFDADVEIEEKYWCLKYEQSSSAHLISSRPQREGHDLLRPLAEPKVRPCVSLSSAGFEIGLEYFPADATVEQAITYFEHYSTDLQQEADNYGNTHALLYFRLLMARWVYHEYEQYRSVERWAQEKVKKEWVERDFSSSRLENPAKLMSAIEELLADPPQGESGDIWRKEEGTWMPNVKAIHSLLMKRNPNVLRRKPDAYGGEHATPQTLRNYVNYFPEKKLVALRTKAGLYPK
jgi:hypothetical protein